MDTMEALKYKREAINKALTTLQTAINFYAQVTCKSFINEKLSPSYLNHDEIRKTARDSLIQRFEFTVDSLWKYVKDYLEFKEHIVLDIKTPRATIRALCTARFINETDAEIAIKMIEDRNMTSHMYKEEFADEISIRVESYHTMIKKILSSLK